MARVASVQGVGVVQFYRKQSSRALVAKQAEYSRGRAVGTGWAAFENWESELART